MNPKLQICLLSAMSMVAMPLAGGCERTEHGNDPALIERVTALEAKVEALSQRAPAPRAQPGRPQPGVVYRVPVADHDAYRGGRHAKVTIVEAFEFACPYCAQIAGVMDELLEAYPDESLRVVSKHFVVHPQLATEAALATCAADRQGRFAEYEAKLWKTVWASEPRPRLVRENLAWDKLSELAGEVGLDPGRFERDAKGPCKAVLAQSMREWQELGVRGTPTLFINGKAYLGPRTVAALKQAIDQEIARADAAISGGIALSDYYEQLISRGKKSI